jgi:gliding motility-associated-like protein
MEKYYSSVAKKIFLLILLACTAPVIGKACDGSGFIVNGITNNNDGTFTLDVTIYIAGADHPGGTFGGTRGFWFNTDAPGGIVDVQPPSLTSINGTTLPTVIMGGQVSWGAPNSGPFFVAASEPTQTFNIQLTVMGEPSSWTGGGQEVGNCGPSFNNGAGPEYSGCFPPSISILPVGPVCAGQPLNISAITTGGNVTVNWSNGMFGNDITIFPTSDITLVATANNGCNPATAQISIQVAPLPTVDPIPPISICEGEPVALNAVTTNADDIFWSNGAVGNPNIFNALFSEIIIVTAANACGTAEEMIEVNVTPDPTMFVIEGDNVICENEEVLIEVEVQNQTSFSWSNGDMAPATFVTPTATTTYTATASNECETVEETITITVNPLPELDILTPDQSICAGESVNLSALATDVAMINWSNGDEGPVITVTPAMSQTYVASGVNDCGVASESVSITVNTPPALSPVTDDQLICIGDDVDLEVSVFNADTFSWSEGSTTPVINVMPDTSTTYIATATNECGTDTFAIEVNILPPPSLTVIDDSEDICEGDSSTIAIAPELASAVSWSTGAVDTFITVSPLTQTDYTVTLSNACGTADSTFTVDVTLLPVLTLDNPGSDICEGDTTTLSVTAANEDSFSWNTGATTLTIEASPAVTTTFTAVAANICGTDQEDVTINVFEVYNTTLELLACPDDTLFYQGVPLQAGDTQSFTLSSFDGCDSVVNVTVLSYPTYEEDLLLQACTGSSVFYNGTELFPGDSVAFTLNTINGCDSIINVTVEELSVFFTDVSLQACENETTSFDGVTLNPGDAQSFMYITADGCDSIVNVTVETLPTFSSTLNLQACAGSTISYNGTTLNPGDTSAFVFSALNACDSTVTVIVEELPTYESDLAFAICPGTSITYAGQTLSPGDAQSFTFSALNGCDSTINVNVAALPTFTSTLNLQACTGSTASYNNTTLNPGDTTDFVLTAFNGCDSTVTVIVEEWPLSYTTLTLEACTGTTANYNGTILNPGDTTDFTFTAFNGCDSIVTVIVEELAIFESELELEACTGTTVDYNGTTLNPGDQQSFVLSAFNGCDSTVNVTVIELPTYEQDLMLTSCANETTAYNGTTLNPGDVQSFTFATVDGCDSIVNVMVETLPLSSSVVELEACTGTTTTYNGSVLNPGDTTDFVFSAFNGCDSTVTVIVEELAIFETELDIEACANTTVTYAGVTLNPGDNQSFTLTALNGCDSTVNVSIISLPTFESTVNLQACTGTTADYLGNALNPGDTTVFVYSAFNGCDSVVTVIVEELPLSQSSLQLEACTGTTLDYNGTTLSPGDTTDFTFTAFNGCDSVVTVIVEELPLSQSNLQLEACTGTTLDYNGTTLNPGDQQDFVFSAFNGCDSTVEVTVIELPVFESDLTLQACTGFTTTYNGVVLNPGDSQDFTLTALNGCDSVVHVEVEEVDILASDLSLRTCPGSTITFEGSELNIGDVQDFTFTSQDGCDSIVTVTVTPYATYDEEVILEACTGTTLEYNNIVLNPGDSTAFTFNTINGCDSIVRVIVEELQIFEQDLPLATCPGTPITYEGTALFPGQQQSFTFTAANGCDSTVNVSVAALPTFESDLALEACVGATVTYNGVELSPGAAQSFVLTADNGCDSTVNVTVTGVDIYETDFALQACTGTTVDYNGTTLSAGDVEVFTFTSQIGCDSLVTVSVEELLHTESELQLQACEGSTITYNGTTLLPGEQEDFVFTAANGCDSTVHVEVIEVLHIFTEETREICDGESSEIFGTPIFTGGEYSQTFTSVQDCDSTHTIYLTVNPLPALEVDTENACPDESNGFSQITASNAEAPYFYLWDDGSALSARDDLTLGSYEVTVTDALGCAQTTTVNIAEHSISYATEVQDISCYAANDGLLQITSATAGLSYSLDGTNFSTTGIFSKLGPGTYDLLLEDVFGCRYEEPGIIVEEPDELIVFLPEDEIIEVGDSILVNAQSNGGADLIYVWTPQDILNCEACATPYAQPLQTTYLSVVVQNANNCIAEDRMLIIVERNRNVYIPNIFSPNNDGANDLFFINAGSSVTNIQSFVIYNRWGEPVFETYNIPPNDPSKGWDGTFRGELMNSAVFTYFAELEFVDGEVILFKGDVTLMR